MDWILNSISLPRVSYFLVVLPEDYRGNIVGLDRAQERENRKETRYTQMLASFQKSKPRVFKGQGRSKCLICRQARHWAKECPNHDKSPKTACYKCHQLGHWASRASGPKSLKVKCQPFPHNGSTGLKQPAPANPPVTDNHHGAGAKGATGCGR